MGLVEDNETGGFTFTWSIHNFSYCVQKKTECLKSPTFVVNSIEDTVWNLQLYPRGRHNTNGFISFYLNRGNKSATSVKFTLSIRASDGTCVLFKGLPPSALGSSISLGRHKFLSLKELLEPGGAYLDNDKLTLRCRMWLNDDDLLTSVKCYAHTKIKVTKIDCMWIVDDFENKYNSNLTKEIRISSPEIPYFTVHLFKGESFGDDTIHFAIKLPQDDTKLFLDFKICLLDADGKVAHSIQGEYLFPDLNETQIRNLPFLSRRQLLSKKELYLPGGRLTVRCKFSASTGDVNEEIESFESGITEDVQLKSAVHEEVPDLSNPWTENMKKFYKDGKFSDVTVHAPNRQFPVHKAILCAQSEVFCAMFERDMKENRTGIVEIEDLEDDTVSTMLLFLYTNSLEDLDFSMACKLYFAADKYQIVPLHKKCSEYLKDSLDNSKVCDVLALADTHQDQDLKLIAQDFISVHDQEIIMSEDWKKLMKAKAYLTSETMQLIFCKKFQNNLKP